MMIEEVMIEDHKTMTEDHIKTTIVGIMMKTEDPSTDTDKVQTILI